jgi:pheromone receptor transcription factor
MDQRKKTKGRQKIEMKKIENEDDRLITFSKRRSGIYKKASELVTLCGAEVGVVIFSPAGKPFSFGHPSVESVANRLLKQNPPQGDNTHPLVEAHRRVRINELNQQYNELFNQLEVEKERGKALQKLTKARGNKGWWEVPSEELNHQELQKMNQSLEKLHKNLFNRIKEKAVVGASSSSSAFLIGNSTQGTNPFVLNAGGIDPLTFPPSYGYGRGHF